MTKDNDKEGFKYIENHFIELEVPPTPEGVIHAQNPINAIIENHFIKLEVPQEGLGLIHAQNPINAIIENHFILNSPNKIGHD